MTEDISTIEASKDGYWAACDDKPRESPFEKDSKADLEWLDGYDDAVRDFEIY